MDKNKVGLSLVKKPSIDDKKLNDWLHYLNVGRGKRSIKATDEDVQLIKTTVNDPEFNGFRFIDTLITYSNILEGSRVSLEEYVNAVKFCSYLEANNGKVVEAYTRTFHFRDFVKNRMSAPTKSKEYKELSSASTRYRKSPLVVQILAQSSIPIHILFGSLAPEVIQVLFDIVKDTKVLPKDRIKASEVLLPYLKLPENIKVDLNVSTNKEDNIVTRCEDMLDELTKGQLNKIASGQELSKAVNSTHATNSEEEQEYIETDIEKG